MKYAIGIDPGVTGALVLINEDYKLITWQDCPVSTLTKTVRGKKRVKNELAPVAMMKALEDLAYIRHNRGVVKVWLETAQAMPKQGVSSTFKTGRGFGLWEGIIAGLGLTYDLVRPRVWTKVMYQDTPTGEPKEKSLIKAQRLFPELPLMKPKGRVLSMNGRSDAALIAYYGMLSMNGG